MSPGPRPPALPAELDPLLSTLAARSLLYRVHSVYFDASAFNPGYVGGARFHFIRDAAGARVPALYAAESEAAAIAETVFHDVPVRPAGLRVVSFSRKIRDRELSALRTRREIELVQLHDLGLDRLGLRAPEITDTDPSEYPATRRWAEALHRCGAAGGLAWMSRRYNSKRVFTFFGDRVGPGDLQPLGEPLPLGRGPGLELVYELAEAAGITVTHD